MCRIELTTKTITAESRIGSHKAVMGTMCFSYRNGIGSETGPGNIDRDSARAYMQVGSTSTKSGGRLCPRIPVPAPAHVGTAALGCPVERSSTGGVHD